MRYLISAFLINILVLSSCSAPNNTGVKNDGAFQVHEAPLKQGILQISLPTERPKNLAIQTPNGEWFVIQDSEESIEAMTQNQFNTINVMEFELNKLIGVVWRDGIKAKELIFKAHGTYLVYFANNLETETENTFSLQESVLYP